MHLPLTTAERGRVPGRRLLAAAAGAPALVLVAVTAGGGWAAAPAGWLAVVGATAVVGAAALASYVPLAGQSRRDAVGCSPCAAMSAFAVVGAVLLIGSRPHDVPMAALALGLAALGLARRRGAAYQACPAS